MNQKAKGREGNEMKKYSEMTIEEAVKALHIERRGDKIGCYGVTGSKAMDAAVAYMRANKPAIMQYLLEQEEAERQYLDKVHAIPGLDEIEAAKADLAAWRDEWEASFDGESGGGTGVRPRPQYDLEAMYAQYPRAAAYLKAREYAQSGNYIKSGAGAAAAERIVNGEDYDVAISEMEQQWSAYCEGRAWD